MSGPTTTAEKDTPFEFTRFDGVFLVTLVLCFAQKISTFSVGCAI